MAQSQTELYNLALSAVGARKTVSAPTENSREAEQCNLWYGSVRANIFRAAHWGSIKRFARLGLLVERDTAADWVTTDPEPGFIYSYSLPVGCVAARYLSTFERFTTGVYYSTNVRALFTDMEDAVLCYSFDQTNTALWDHSLYLAVAYGLAAHICLPLSGKPERASGLIKASNAIIAEARAQSANEQQGTIETLPEWITTRGYKGSPSTTRYFAPFGEYLSMMGAPVV